VEILRIYDGDISEGIARGFGGMRGNGEEGIVTPGVHRQGVVAGDRGLLDAGQSSDTMKHAEQKIGSLFFDAVGIGSGIVGLRNPDLDRSETLRIKAGMDLEHVPETAEKQTGAGKQDDGKSDFRNDENARNARMLPAVDRAATAFAKIFELTGACGLQGRD
jgi:hypothetical protein